MFDDLQNELISLKAQVYDLLAQRQVMDQHLNNLNLRIQQTQQDINRQTAVAQTPPVEE